MVCNCAVLRGKPGITLRVALSSYGWVQRIAYIYIFMEERGVCIVALKKALKSTPIAQNNRLDPIILQGFFG